LNAVTGKAAARRLVRRRSRNLRLGPIDALAYVIGGGILALLLASAVESAAAVEATSESGVSGRSGALLAGMAIVVALSAAVASGRRGGPLALAAPIVMHVMLAPIDRGAVLRASTMRRVAAAGGAGALVAGLLWIALATSTPRTSPAVWIVAGAVAGVTWAGLALLGAGLRISGRTSAVIQTVIVAWWLGDVAVDTATSPMTTLARMPFTAPSPAGITYVVAVALALAGLAVYRIGGLSIEMAWRRSRRADQLLVAIGLNDLRTALLVLRRRAIESPRPRPWRTLAGPWTARHPIAARSTRALMRWPVSRVGRFGALAAACGVVAVGAAHAVALSLVAVMLTFAAALDAVDALSEELDHPDLHRGYPIAAEALALRHLAVPLVAMIGFGLVASVTAGVVAGRSAALTGVVASPVAALAAVAGAALTASRIARPFTNIADIGLPPEVVGPRIVARAAAPILPLSATLLPVLAAHRAGPGSTVLAVVPAGMVSLVVLGWVLYRTRLERLLTNLLAMAARR
jgi:hypothetical protein